MNPTFVRVRLRTMRLSYPEELELCHHLLHLRPLMMPWSGGMEEMCDRPERDLALHRLRASPPRGGAMAMTLDGANHRHIYHRSKLLLDESTLSRWQQDPILQL